jgi:pilus assembly protein CpaB
MGKYRSFIMFGIAIFLALIVTVLIINWLQTKTKTKEAAPLETQEVAIAKVDLQWGTTLTKEVIDRKSFLKGSLPPGTFSDESALVGRVLISPVKANEPILESRLAPTSIRTGGVAAVVSPKKRAVAVKVDKVIGVAGFIHPNNRVDVLVTLNPEKAKTGMTKTVLENILVLAAGPELEAKGKEEKQSPVDVVTLEVSPEEAEKLALAATEGRILLVLRNFSDTEEVLTKGMTIPVLLASYSGSSPGTETKPAPARAVVRRSPAPSKAPAPVVEQKVKEEKEKPKPYVVEVIKGSKISEVKFEGGE